MVYPNWWDKKVTIYHKHETKDENERTHIEWVRSVFKNCFAGTKDKKVMSGNEILSVNVNIVRIPCPVDVLPGDIIVLADVSNDKTLKSDIAIKNKYPDSFIVKEVHDNTKVGFLSHVCISG